jgi:hypothetical protein
MPISVERFAPNRLMMEWMPKYGYAQPEGGKNFAPLGFHAKLHFGWALGVTL